MCYTVIVNKVKYLLALYDSPIKTMFSRVGKLLFNTFTKQICFGNKLGKFTSEPNGVPHCVTTVTDKGTYNNGILFVVVGIVHLK